MISVPADGVEPPQKAVPGAGWGLSKLGQFDMSEYELVL